MRLVDGELLLSSQDLRDFVECNHAADLDILDVTEPSPGIARTEDSDLTRLLQGKGIDFEDGYHRKLVTECTASGKTVVEIDSGKSVKERASDTVSAMGSGIDVIYQAGLHSLPWHGYPDYLRKVPGQSRFGDFQYEVMDIKSSLAPTKDHILQISLYSYLTGRVQDSDPTSMFLTTGSLEVHRYKYSDYTHYLMSVMSEFMKHIEDRRENPPDTGTVPLRRSFCEYCKWRGYCDGLREESDHISLVAGVDIRNSGKLRVAGVETVTDLANVGARRINGIGPDALSNISRNAQLLLAKRQSGNPQVEIKDTELGRGFHRLPEPSPGDLFLDLEGDPTYPERRLEYLFGLWDATTDGFVSFWGHDHAGEKKAFEETIDFITGRLVEYPESHIYHYGAYEDTQIKRLAALYSTRESEVDEILRKRKMVDLLKVTRESLRTSESGYGLKELEIFYLGADRVAAIKTAQDSVVLYASWRETKTQELLDQIRDYNLEDCLSTMKCRDWLVSLCPEDIPRLSSGEFEPPAANPDFDVQQLINRLLERAPADESEFRELAGQLTMFHRRSSRPEWWQFFATGELTEEELRESAECVGELELIDIIPAENKRGLPLYEYKYPEQEFKFKETERCVFVGLENDDIAPLDHCGQLIKIDRQSRRIVIRHPRKLDSIPRKFSIAPEGPIPTYMLRDAVVRYTDSVMKGTGEYQAITRFLKGSNPVLEGQLPGALTVPDIDVQSATFDVLRRLQESVLFIQGPPGAGKTTLAGNMIVQLMQSGKKIGISSNSHRAINELLHSVRRHAESDSFEFSGVKKSTRDNPESYFNKPDQYKDPDNAVPALPRYKNIVDIEDTKAIDPDDHDLIAGTAWLFCNAKFDQKLDYLFVDEAGQVSLANLVSIGLSSKNIVLIGDQMQLAHPSPGIHPGKSGDSTLDYMLEGQDTVPPDRGLFLDTSYRMHPNVCNFISDAVYESRLKAADQNIMQSITNDNDGAVNYPSSGLLFIEMEHEGCSQTSHEEAAAVREIFEDLIEQTYTDKSGNKRGLTVEDVMVVAPYNAQVNLLKEYLPAGARVGTIDLFQGQEAPAVIVSMTTSNREDLPRHFDFLFSRNRLNVAISRAQCLSVVIASRDLLSISCSTIDQMALVNTLCWARDYSRSGDEASRAASVDGVTCLECFTQNRQSAVVCRNCGSSIRR